MASAVAATSWQARVARQERGRAETQAAEARFQAARAERESRQAEIYRQRAERDAQFAREQLVLVAQRTREADARRCEATLERERADRRARDIQTITTQLLALNAFLPDVPAGIDVGTRAVASAGQILLGLSSDGFQNPSLGRNVVTAQQFIKEYAARDATVTHACPAAWEFIGDAPRLRVWSGPEELPWGLERIYQEQALTNARFLRPTTSIG